MKLPALFIQQMESLLGSDYPPFFQSLQEESPVSIRKNPLKPMEKEFAGQVPWCNEGHYLESRPLFTADPLFHAGCYYVQEASSMFLEQIITNYIKEPAVCLDLCAAPGGKSTHLSSLLPEGSLLVSNEVIRSRAYILAENLIKWGNPASIATNNDPAEIGKIKQIFDVILADVPCSGEGMFRKDPKSQEEWSPANIKLCAERQQRIISDIWPSLKPGGILIYSTCTYNTRENEENVLWMKDTLDAKILPVAAPSEWGISGSLAGDIPVSRLLPHRTRGEGFFIAAIQKPLQEMNSREKIRKNKAIQAPVPPAAKELLQDPGSYDFQIKNNQISATPQIHQETFQLLKEKLKIIFAGVSIGEMKGKDLIPNHALALSKVLNKKAFPSWEVSAETALRYLSKEAINTLPEGLPTGYVLLTHQGHPLGFVKNIGNRANNLYPQEWRIRMKVI